MKGRTQEKLRAAQALIAAGFTRNDCVALLGVAANTLLKYLGEGAHDYGLDTRNAKVAELYRSGMTLEQVSLQFNITRERVRQILRKLGVSATEGGGHLRCISNQIAEARTRLDSHNVRCMDSYGCDYETAKALNDGLSFTTTRCKAVAYMTQRGHCGTRGVQFQMTFPEWWDVWEKSGKWSERGRGKDRYCMARHSDSGPYAPGNVYITTNAMNASDSYKFRPAQIRHKSPYANSNRSVFDLSPRQKEVLALSEAGVGPKEIADRLGIARGTAAGTLSAARAKVRLAKQEEAVAA